MLILMDSHTLKYYKAISILKIQCCNLFKYEML